MTNANRPSARYDASRGALVIEGLSITQDAVLHEARHWASGLRGPAAEASELADVDLAPFVEQALTVGSSALAAAGGTQQAFAVEKLVSEAEQRAKAASDAAATQTAQAVRTASEALTKATEQTARDIAGSIQAANKALTDEVTRLVGGTDPELVRKLQPLLDATAGKIKEQAVKDTTTLIDRVQSSLNPANPESPMAAQMRALAETQNRQTQALADEQRKLATKLDELVQAVAVKSARDKVVAATALKGATYEERMHALLAALAAGLGDEYLETGTVTGLRQRNKKGDGVLAIEGGDVRVVVELTDSARPNWSNYLAEAEDNRAALAGLGIAKTVDQLGGQTLLTLGPRRIVLAFDPETDDPDLLRCVVQVLRLSAAAAAARHDAGELATADEALRDALDALERLSKIRKGAQVIRRNADVIETESNTLETELARQLGKAQSAIAGAAGQSTSSAA